MTHLSDAGQETQRGRDERGPQRYWQKCSGTRPLVQAATGEDSAGFCWVLQIMEHTFPQTRQPVMIDVSFIDLARENYIHNFFFFKESECTTLIAVGLGSDILEVEEGREPLHWLIFWGRGQCEQIEILRGESIVQSRYYWLSCSCVTGGRWGLSSFQSVGQASPCPPTYSPSSVDPQGGPVLLESEAEALCFENIHFLS